MTLFVFNIKVSIKFTCNEDETLDLSALAGVVVGSFELLVMTYRTAYSELGAKHRVREERMGSCTTRLVVSMCHWPRVGVGLSPLA